MVETLGYRHRSALPLDAIQPKLSRDERLETVYRTALSLPEKHFDRHAVIAGSDAHMTAVKGSIINTAQRSTLTEQIHAIPSGTLLVSDSGRTRRAVAIRARVLSLRVVLSVLKLLGGGRLAIGVRFPTAVGLHNMKRNLARQHEKGSSIDL